MGPFTPSRPEFESTQNWVSETTEVPFTITRRKDPDYWGKKDLSVRREDSLSGFRVRKSLKTYRDHTTSFDPVPSNVLLYRRTTLVESVIRILGFSY